MARPGLCQPTAFEKLRMTPAVVFGSPLCTPLRVLRRVGEWTQRDPLEPHCHLGPLTAESHLQGQQIGSKMLASFCAHLGKCRTLSYLETQKLEDAHLYQKFGFTVVAEAEALEVPSGFMSRPARIATKE